jgi:uncharacterized membrane protein (DUF106 family)
MLLKNSPMIAEILQWLAGLAQFILGILIGTILTGMFTWKVVVPKIMQNEDVQELKRLINEIITALKVLENDFKEEDLKELIKTFKELREFLKAQKTEKKRP